MDKKGFSEKDVLKWIAITAALALAYIIIKALLSATK